MFDTGELHLKQVAKEDEKYSFRCEITDQFIGQTLISSTFGHFVITGKMFLNYNIFISLITGHSAGVWLESNQTLSRKFLMYLVTCPEQMLFRDQLLVLSNTCQIRVSNNRKIRRIKLKTRDPPQIFELAGQTSTPSLWSVVVFGTKESYFTEATNSLGVH